jgi:hypothetical protein
MRQLRSWLMIEPMSSTPFLPGIRPSDSSFLRAREKVEAAIGRYKCLIGDPLRSREDARRVREIKNCGQGA